MPKLPKGMYRRGRSFYVRIQEGGRDLRRSLGTNYERALRQYRGVQQSKGTFEVGNERVAESVTRWLQTAVAAGRIPSGQRDIAARMERYALPLMGRWVVSRVRPDDLLGLRRTLEEQGLPPTRVRRILGDVRSFFRWASLEAQLIAHPPIPRRLIPRVHESFPERLSEDEAEAVAAVPDPYGFAVRLGLASGLRWGELTRVRREDVVNGVLRVHRSKSGKVRVVPLGSEILQELEARDGRPVPFVHPGMFARQVRKYSRVERFHTHLLRHTFACRWVERGGNLAVLQEILGHSSIMVTQRYAKLSAGAIVAEAARVAGKSGTVSGTPPIKRLGVRAVTPVSAAS